jgi:hypothetical protein
MDFGFVDDLFKSLEDYFILEYGGIFLNSLYFLPGDHNVFTELSTVRFICFHRSKYSSCRKLL